MKTRDGNRKMDHFCKFIINPENLNICHPFEKIERNKLIKVNYLLTLTVYCRHLTVNRTCVVLEEQ